MIVVGFGLLAAGGELLVRGASRLAAAAGISPLVIGLTVVALGTSAPEMAVTLQASLRGQSDLAVGNVVGSNICNVLLILGLSALAAPLAVSGRLVRFDVPLMIAASVAVFVLGMDGRFGRADGAVLFAGLVGYVVWNVAKSRSESREARCERENGHGTARASRSREVGGHALLVVAGLVLLTVGSNWLVLGASAIARMLGVGELLIGLTIVAAGTSLPELATSVVASLRGERDIAVGNVIGSNLFNILAVLGLSALLAPDGIAVSRAAIELDIPVMIAVAVACFPIFLAGHRVGRWEGGLLFAGYLGYEAYRILEATNEHASRALGQVMLGVAVPFVIATLAFNTIRTIRRPAAPTGDNPLGPGQAPPPA